MGDLGAARVDGRTRRDAARQHVLGAAAVDFGKHGAAIDVLNAAFEHGVVRIAAVVLDPAARHRRAVIQAAGIDVLDTAAGDRRDVRQRRVVHVLGAAHDHSEGNAEVVYDASARHHATGGKAVVHDADIAAGTDNRAARDTVEKDE